jgi:hypothetical protein
MGAVGQNLGEGSHGGGIGAKEIEAACNGGVVEVVGVKRYIHQTMEAGGAVAWEW